MQRTTATGATSAAVVTDRLVRRDMLVLRLETGRRRRGAAAGRAPGQRVIRSTR